MKPYPLPKAKVDVIKGKVKEMLTLKAMEPAISHNSLLIRLVQKHRVVRNIGTHRFCVDYCRLNYIFIPELIFTQSVNRKLFSQV